MRQAATESGIGRKQRRVIEPRAVVVISDSTGSLARHMMGAFLTQFPADAISVRFESFVKTRRHLAEVLQAARLENAAVCHALVLPKLKKQVQSFCQKAELPHRDLTGGTVEFLASVTAVKPRRNLLALHSLDDAYNRRIGAMEYTLSHDDGLGTDSLEEADIVLVGISRTSKTPTSIYLAQQGYRVANVALAMGVDPPRELFAVPRHKVIGLLINPQQLVLIRTRRQAGWRMEQTSYGEPTHVAQEITWARRLFNDSGWRSLDVTDQAIEETAARIIAIVGSPSAGRQSATLAGLE